MAQYTKIMINGTEFYFQVYWTEDDGTKTAFYEKYYKKKTRKTRKYFFGLIGAVLKTETYEVERYKHCFSVWGDIAKMLEVDGYQDSLRNKVKMYFSADKLMSGNMSI